MKRIDRPIELFWDDRNLEKITGHRVKDWEVEEAVVCDPHCDARLRGEDIYSGVMLARGTCESNGAKVFAVLKLDNADLWRWRPITAYKE